MGCDASGAGTGKLAGYWRVGFGLFLYDTCHGCLIRMRSRNFGGLLGHYDALHVQVPFYVGKHWLLVPVGTGEPWNHIILSPVYWYKAGDQCCLCHFSVVIMSWLIIEHSMSDLF